LGFYSTPWDLDPTVGEKEGKGLTVGSSTARFCGQGVDNGEVLEVPSDDEEVDGVKKRTVSPGVWSTMAVVSCRRAGG
jgi:hypothetical protein